MELKAGYKQIEVGVIPEDWDIKNIGNISEVKTGPFGTALHEKDYVDNGTPIITVEHLGEYGVDHSNLPMVSDEDKKRLKSYTLKVGDIAFSRVGSIDRNALIRKKEDGWLFSGRLLRVRVNNEKYDSRYLSYYFHSESFKQRIRGVAVGQTMPSLNTAILKGVKVVLPEMVEQTAIANALSDADALIQSFIRLIAKKRQIKQGAMQILLNPYENGRLKAGWEMKEVDEIAEVRSGKRLPLGNFLTHKETNHPYIRVTDMYYGGIRLNEIMYVPNDIYPSIKNYRIFKEDIFISVAGTLGLVGKIPCELDGANLTENANRFTNIQCDRDYLLFVLSSSLIQNVIDSEKTLGAQPKLALTRIRKFKIPLPIDKQEQTRIATILSDMDAEIAALETKLAKYQHIKQGMMQNLLTGRIRLMKPESKAGALA